MVMPKVMVRVLIVGLVMAGTAEAATGPYMVVDVGNLGDNTSRVRFMNNAGQVGGHIGELRRSFFWEGGSITDIGTLGGTRTDARGISNLGVLAGQSYTSATRWHAFVWDSDGGMDDLGVPSGYSSSSAQDINDLGQVLVAAWTSSDSLLRMFIFDRGVWTDLGTLGGAYSSAKAINNYGHVAGWSHLANGDAHSTLWRDGEIIDLGQNLGAIDINDAGEILGRVDGRAIVWRDGEIIELGTFGGDTSSASHMDNLGRVAGYAADAGGENRPFLWDGGVMVDVNTLLAQPSDWIVTSAVDVNDVGWIAVRATLAGESRSCVLIPDCNENGIADNLDISGGTSEDCNSNNVPDECDLAPPATTCCEAHDEPGCDSPTVEACVCLADPYCCNVEWDRACVELVTSEGCGVCDGDCNDNGVPDECEADFDGDGIIDDCDLDIDGDGVSNEEDACDFTPPGAGIVTDPGDPRYGTLRGDLDGDCDCDLADYAILEGDFTGPHNR